MTSRVFGGRYRVGLMAGVFLGTAGLTGACLRPTWRGTGVKMRKKLEKIEGGWDGLLAWLG